MDSELPNHSGSAYSLQPFAHGINQARAIALPAAKFLKSYLEWMGGSSLVCLCESVISSRGRKSKVEIAIDAPEATYGVVEGAVIRGAKVLLDVARIVVIGDINDLETA